VRHIVKGIKRHRYISFHVSYEKKYSLLTKTELIQALRKHTSIIFSKNTKELGFWIVRFDGTNGILKCNYQEKEHGTQLLQSLKTIGAKSVTITTLVTSGTIHGLTNNKNKRSS
jgi:RNase P/RNase MRP subunit POP5